MKTYYNSYHIQPYSSDSLGISWQNLNLDPQFVCFMQALLQYLKSQDKDIHYLTPSFDTLLIKYSNTIEDIHVKIKQTQSLIENFEFNININTSRTFEIPVCYEDFGVDLKDLSAHTGLSISDIIDIHTSRVYSLLFIGFLPGFLYLGDLDKRICMPRKETPCINVEQGSIGIAEHQTGIYPSVSPGGWQIIGRTPLKIFDVNQNPPSIFKPGDKILFKAIDFEEYDKIENSFPQPI